MTLKEVQEYPQQPITTTAEKFLLSAFSNALLALSSIDESRGYWQEEYTKANQKLSRIPLVDKRTAKFKLAEKAKRETQALTVKLDEMRGRAESELQATYLNAVLSARTLDDMTQEELTALRDQANAKIYGIAERKVE